jgi:GH15 family glucan-1,4-alpha-glucosidase
MDPAIDASLYAPFYFGVLDPRDEKVVNTMNAVKEKLWVKTEVGGIARYEGDGYHKVTDQTRDVPGNPWLICTLWLAQWYIAKARTPKELQEALPILEWVASRALPSGVLAEQVHPLTNQPLSVSPLTWSHATFVSTVLEYVNKAGEVDICPSCGNPMGSHGHEGERGHNLS